MGGEEQLQIRLPDVCNNMETEYSLQCTSLSQISPLHTHSYSISFNIRLNINLPDSYILI